MSDNVSVKATRVSAYTAVLDDGLFILLPNRPPLYFKFSGSVWKRCSEYGYDLVYSGRVVLPDDVRRNI